MTVCLFALGKGKKKNMFKTGFYVSKYLLLAVSNNTKIKKQITFVACLPTCSEIHLYGQKYY